MAEFVQYGVIWASQQHAGINGEKIKPFMKTHMCNHPVTLLLPRFSKKCVSGFRVFMACYWLS
jgi:hypothetical protein